MNSEFAAWNQPNTLEVQISLGAEEIEVAVIVQNADTVLVRDRSQDEIDRRQSVMPNMSELALRIDRASFDLFVNWDEGKSKQLLNQLIVIVGIAGGIASLE